MTTHSETPVQQLEQSTAGTLGAENARLCLQLLQRAQLSGAEVPAFVKVVNALNTIMGDTD